jgi:hypothetical protein
MVPRLPSESSQAEARGASVRLVETVALFRTLQHHGGRLVDWLFSFGAAAYNLVRWRTLVAQQG